MINTGDRCRQVNAHQGLVTLKSSGRNQTGAFGNNHTGFDGLIGGNEHTVNP